MTQSNDDIAIRVSGLGKRYRIGQPGGYKTLVETMAGWFSPGRPPAPASGGADAGEFWALRDVNFEVKRGEVVGIIGRNGAGKSTLLKVLSRITEPTTGRVEITGRVGSLLEVGTGFHPELTGRENVFLNGAILGMREAEIRKNFDEIVAFAEIEQFIDTPVKRYSSGMYTRLAFAVAAHLEPEILIVDEVLAVGDAAFQKKCMGKMKDVADHGRTVLFVSHNMAAIQRLCSSGVLLRKGSVQEQGPIAKVTVPYLSEGANSNYLRDAPVGTEPKVLSAGLVDENGMTKASALSSERLTIGIRWTVPNAISGLRIGIGVNTATGTRIFSSAPEDTGTPSPMSAKTYQATIAIPENLLLAGAYGIAICLWSGAKVYDYPDPAFSLTVEPGIGLAYLHDNSREGFVQLACPWTIV